MAGKQCRCWQTGSQTQTQTQNWQPQSLLTIRCRSCVPVDRYPPCVRDISGEQIVERFGCTHAHTRSAREHRHTHAHNTHTHTHTHTLTHTHAHTHTHMHARTCTHTRTPYISHMLFTRITDTDTYTHAHTCTHAHAHKTHTRTQGNPHLDGNDLTDGAAVPHAAKRAVSDVENPRRLVPVYNNTLCRVSDLNKRNLNRLIPVWHTHTELRAYEGDVGAQSRRVGLENRGSAIVSGCAKRFWFISSWLVRHFQSVCACV